MIAVITAEGAVLAAMAEFAVRVLLPLVKHNGIRNVNAHAVWLSPLANALLLLQLIACIALVARLAGRHHRQEMWMRAAAYSFALAQGALLLGRLHIVSALVLAVGMGSVVARLCARTFWRQAIRLVAAGGGVVIVAWALGLLASREWSYRKAIAALPAVSGERTNVLLLILDTVSAQEMSLYGYPRKTTPVLDSLAQHGVVFDWAISSAPWTLPSHASVFTGRDAIELPTRYLVPLDDKTQVVSEVFADAGYVTAGFVGNLEYTSRASGLARGFHRYEDFRPSLLATLTSSAVGGRLARWLSRGGRPLQAGRKDALEVNREFLAWQRSVGQRPWFAFLNYYDAHDPYVPPLPDERRFLETSQEPVYDVEQVTAKDSAKVESARALHDAALFALDRAIGDLLAELRQRNELDRTVIVVTADHGEEFGERGVLLHGNSLYLPSIRVPLLVVYPGRVPAGRRVAQPVGTRNLARTLPELAGVSAGELGGTSLMPYWQGTSVPPPATIVSWVERTINQPPDYPASRSELLSVVTDSAQVIFGADTVVFELTAPPGTARDRRYDASFQNALRTALNVARPRR